MKRHSPPPRGWLQLRNQGAANVGYGAKDEGTLYLGGWNVNRCRHAQAHFVGIENTNSYLIQQTPFLHVC